MDWVEFVAEYGYNIHRQALLSGLKMACKALGEFGCKAVFIDGSFITKKDLPNDFDACWDPNGVDVAGLIKKYPLFLDIRPPRTGQKGAFKGELFPSTTPAGSAGTMLNFFQVDRDGFAKGIIRIDLKTVI